MLRLRVNNSSGLLMVVGVVLALAAAGMVWMLGKSAHQTARVLVALRNVPSLTELASTDVGMRAVPIQAVPRDALHTPAQAEGRFVRYGLLAGQIVQSANLAATAAGASRFDERLTAASTDDPNLRAVTLAVAPKAGLVLPSAGDHVDLLGVVTTGTKNAAKQARVLVQHVLVLDRLVTGGSSSSSPTGKPGQPNAGQVRQGMLVLALTVPKAQQVALAQASGTVEVVLDPLKYGGNVSANPLTEASWKVKQTGSAAKSAKGGR